MIRKERIWNHIFKIRNSNGNMIEDPSFIQNSAMDFFSNLMQLKEHDISMFNSSLISFIIFTNDNNFFRAIPTLQEIRETVFDIDKNSVAGSDGFSLLFYRHCWNIISKDLLDVVIEFFRHTTLPQGVTSYYTSFVAQAF